MGCAYGAFQCGYGLGSGGVNELSIENCVSQAVGCLGPVGNLASCLQSLIRCKCPDNNDLGNCLVNASFSQVLPQDTSAGTGLSNYDLRDVYAARSYVAVELMEMLVGDTGRHGG